jgi:Na+-transporting NADH:ubiquinone oxidoreductase subunit F
MIQVALGLLTLSGLTAILALLLEAADSYFGDYGECRVDINQGEKSLTVQGGGKLLGTLMDQGIFIPSACGGRGSCGLCKLKVLEGGGPILPTETPYMEPKEIEDLIRLSCQVKIRNDLLIEIPPELFLIKEYRTEVIGLTDLTPTIKEVHLKLIEPEEINFKAGQFIQFEVPEYEGCPEPVYRAYSIASSASIPTEIKLCVTIVPEGLATTYIHKFLRVGDEVKFNGPYGDFYLRESDREMIMVATGSGLAPMMSILYQMMDESISRKVTLFFGTRSKEDLFYLEEMQEFKKRLPGFEFIPVLSDLSSEEHWEGETGIVTDAVANRFPDCGDKEGYLCGNPLMIDAATVLFQEKGLPGERIFYDKFA